MGEVISPLATPRFRKDFAFKSFKWICLWMLSVYPLLVATCCFLLAKEGSSTWILIFVALVFVVGLAGLNAVLSMSLIVVDNESISRSILGKRWQTIRWDNIERMRVFSVIDPGISRTIRGFNIFPRAYPRLSLTPKGKMSFVERAEDMSELIEILNRIAKIYGIPVESTVGHNKGDSL
jgi:hypothetical protein